MKRCQKLKFCFRRKNDAGKANLSRRENQYHSQDSQINLIHTHKKRCSLVTDWWMLLRCISSLFISDKHPKVVYLLYLHKDCNNWLHYCNSCPPHIPDHINLFLEKDTWKSHISNVPRYSKCSPTPAGKRGIWRTSSQELHRPAGDLP